MRELVLNRKNSALIQTQIGQISGHPSTNIFIPTVCVHIFMQIKAAKGFGFFQFFCVAPML